MLHFKACFVIFTLLFVRIDGFQDDVTTFFELLKHYSDRPITVDAFLCWENARTVAFGRRLFGTSSSTLLLHDLRNRFDTNAIEIDYIPSHLAHTVIFFLDLRCDGALGILVKAEKSFLLNEPYKWVIIAENQNNIDQNENDVRNERQWNMNEEHDNLTHCEDENERNETNDNILLAEQFLQNIPELNNLNIFPDSDVNIIADFLSNDSWSYFRIYKVGKSTEMLVEANFGPENKDWQPLALRRWNLSKAPLKACYVLTDNDTIHHLTDYKQKEIDTITKVNFVLTNHLMEALNASPSYTYESTWGYRQKDGMWSGMLGELVEQRADIGGSPLFFTEDRVSVVEYIAMPTPTRSKFVFRQPKLSYTNNVFALPFRGDVWACSAVLAIVLAVLLGATATWETKIKKDTSHSSWGDAMVMTIGAVCQQGTYVQLKGGVGRALTLSLFLSLMFLYTSYSANIVALLQSSSSRIKTLSDLLNSRLKLAVHDTVFNRYYFSTATEPVRKAIYQKKIAPPGQKPRFITLEEGVRNIKQGLFAFHMEIGVGYKVVGEIFREDEKCGLQEIQYLQVVDPYLAVQKNSSYKEMFKIGMARIQEYGLQSRQNWMLYTHRPSCTRGGSFVSVGLLDVRPALTLLVWGLIAGAVGLILEILLAKRSKIKEALMCRKKFNRKRRS